MTKETERLKEIEAKKAELKEEIRKGEADAERLTAIKAEAEKLAAESEEIRGKMALDDLLEPKGIVEQKAKEKTAAEQFALTNRMTLPLFIENRSVLVSSGTLALPKKTYTQIGELPDVVSSIVDDVMAIDATGTGSWEFPYRATDAAAADVDEGDTIGGTAGTFGKITIESATWGILDEISNQVKKMTPVAYQASVRNNAYFALRKKAKEQITSQILDSALIETVADVDLDEKFLRKIVLGFNSDESVAGGTKLYINKADLITLGDVRGTNEKKPLYEIKFTDENNGILKEGGMEVKFSINNDVQVGTQLYGQPQTVKFLMWGNYEISTDDGGDYFKRNMLGIRGLCTANAGLTVYHGMQKITQPVGTN